jgi:sugar/nucleoside kinase (ribokinase family)
VFNLNDGIAIAGTIAVDEIKKIDKFPNKSELTVIQSVRKSIGGAVSNCSVSLAKIDPTLPIEAIALIGNDEKGRFLISNLEKYKNINLQHVRITGDTPFTDVIQDGTDHSRTFFSYKGNSSSFNETMIDFSRLKSKILHVAYILLLDSLDQEDDLYGTRMAMLLKTAQDFGVKTSIDIVSENSNRYKHIVPPSLKYTNYCVINELEAGKSVGIALRDGSGKFLTEKIPDVLFKLKGMGVKDWVIIHTPEGSFGYNGEEICRVPSLLIDGKCIKGTVGAGDAYVSGVLYGALKGLSLGASMELGTAVAASSLLEVDSTSGVKRYEELMEMYREFPKRKFEEELPC